MSYWLFSVINNSEFFVLKAIPSVSAIRGYIATLNQLKQINLDTWVILLKYFPLIALEYTYPSNIS
jgi:hypothetical protein